MQLTAEQLKEAEKWAELLFSPREIAVVMELPPDEFVQEFQIENSKINLAVTRGKLMSEGQIRKSIIELAKGGSATAQEQAMEIIEKYNILL